MPKATDAQTQKNNKLIKQDDNSIFLKTSDDTVLEGHITIIAPFGHGKTTLAASASQFFPAALPAKKKTELADMLWLQFDRGGTASFATNKLFVRHIIDARALIAAKGVVEGGKAVVDMAGEVITKFPEIENVVPDTVTRWDLALQGHYSKVHANSTNTYAKWNDILDRHARMYNGLDALGRRLISTFHTKAKPDPQTAQQGATQKAGELPSLDSDLIHQVSGQARSLYLGDASLKLALYARVDKREGTQWIVYPFGGKEMEGGCRYHELLDQEEPANLQAIFAKIKGGLK